jgi:outer membrane biosynthesis protein TonB
MNRHAFRLALASAAFLVVAGCGDGAAEEERTSPLSASKSAVHDRRIASAPLQELTGLSHLPSPANDGEIGASLRRHYPRDLLAQQIRGAVLVDIRLDDRGVVQDVHAVSPASRPTSTDEHRLVVRERVNGQVVEREVALTYDARFGPAAEAALRNVRFLPALRDGRAVPFTLRMTVEFSPPQA